VATYNRVKYWVVMYLAANLVSFLTVKKLNKFSTTDKVTICNAMFYFFWTTLYNTIQDEAILSTINHAGTD